MAEALQLFDERGYEQTKVEDVAAAAQVSPRTVYRYFPTKPDLIFSGIPEVIDRLTALIAARPVEEGPYEAMRGAVLEMAPELDNPLTAARSRVIAASPTLQAHSLQIRARSSEAAAEALGQRPGSLSYWQRLLIADIGVNALTYATREFRQRGGRGKLCEIAAEMLDAVPRLASGAVR